MTRGDEMIYIAICDDDKETLKYLKNEVDICLKEKNRLAEVTTYTQSEMLFYDIQEKKHFDLILSDIEMPKMNGMELAGYIKTYLPQVFIIFITAHLKYAIDAYELSIFRYVLKNMISERLKPALHDVLSMIDLQANNFYKIETTSRIEKIPYKNILYIQREGKNAAIVQTGGASSKVRKSLSQVFDELIHEDFIYVDRGTIVNLMHVMSVSDRTIKLTNGICLYPSHAKLEEIKSKLSKFWREHI